MTAISLPEYLTLALFISGYKVKEGDSPVSEFSERLEILWRKTMRGGTDI
jgi:hypothetical protein